MVKAIERAKEFLESKGAVSLQELEKSDEFKELPWNECFARLEGKTLVLTGRVTGRVPVLYSYQIGVPREYDWSHLTGVDFGRKTIRVGKLTKSGYQYVQHGDLHAFLPNHVLVEPSEIFISDHPLEGKRVDTIRTKYSVKKYAEGCLSPEERKRYQARIDEVAMSEETASLLKSGLAKICSESDTPVTVVDVQYRLKTVEGIESSLNRNIDGRTLENLCDINGFRILVNSVEECYWALRSLENELNFICNEDTFDKIAYSKFNGFQALMCKCLELSGCSKYLGPSRHTFNSIEFQVQTVAMYQRALNDEYRQ